MNFAPRYAEILEHTTPYLISYRANWPHLDLTPLGVEIPAAHRYDPTHLESRDVVDGLHRLDRLSFGPQDMLMPRWALFDCGEFPGAITGLGVPAAALPDSVRRAYHVTHRPDAFVPLSMWVAIRCAEPHAWFGHNLSSANLILGQRALPGLGTLTKALGLAVTRAHRQYGATQWLSRSLHLHLSFGDLRLLSAYTPAHSQPATFAYRLEVERARLEACLSPGWRRPGRAAIPPDSRQLSFAADDGEVLLDLHAHLEDGQRWWLVDSEERLGLPALIHLAGTPS